MTLDSVNGMSSLKKANVGIAAGLTAQYKLNAQFSASLWSPRNVSDAHRAGPNRLSKQTNIASSDV